MLSPNRIKFIRSLATKKGRNEENLFIVEGIKLVAELLGSAYKIHSIYGLEGWMEANRTLLEKKQVEFQIISDNDLERISQLNSPNQVLAVVHQNNAALDLNTLGDKMVLALDNVNDPGNLGTIIRIADWFGIDTLICSENTVEHYNTKVVQASMGSFFRVNVVYADLLQTINQYKANYPNLGVYAAVLGGKNLYQASIAAPGMLVMGSESHGISAEVEKMATELITIPSYAGSKAESLNVAVSTAIICAEIRRGVTSPLSS